MTVFLVRLAVLLTWTSCIVHSNSLNGPTSRCCSVIWFNPSRVCQPDQWTHRAASSPDRMKPWLCPLLSLLTIAPRIATSTGLTTLLGSKMAKRYRSLHVFMEVEMTLWWCRPSWHQNEFLQHIYTIEKVIQTSQSIDVSVGMPTFSPEIGHSGHLEPMAFRHAFWLIATHNPSLSAAPLVHFIY
jgi:hypothetical protein